MSRLIAPNLREKAEVFLEQMKDRKLTLATAESCTGGLLAGLLTEVPGASEVLTHGFVTYANDAKISMLNVQAALIEQHGAVSEEVARAMAVGALEASGAGIAVAITGIAGPGGGSAEKPVGLVHLATARAGLPVLHTRHMFTGDRTSIRQQAVQAAMQLVKAS